MLGHSTRRVYSTAELFVLQSLANEIAWVAREFQSQKEHRVQIGDLAHDVTNTLQLIVGYTALIRQNLKGVLDREQERFFANIETDVERILQQLSHHPAVLTAEGEAAEVVAAIPVKSAAELKC